MLKTRIKEKVQFIVNQRKGEFFKFSIIIKASLTCLIGIIGIGVIYSFSQLYSKLDFDIFRIKVIFLYSDGFYLH